MIFMRHLLIVLAVFILMFSLWGGSLRAECGEPHGEPEAPPATPSPTPSGEGGATGGDTGSTTTDTGATGDTTVGEQLGTTFDPSQEIDITGETDLSEEGDSSEEIDIVEGEYTIIALHTFISDPLRAYYEVFTFLVRPFLEYELSVQMDQLSDKAKKWAEDKAREEAGVDEASDAKYQALLDKVDAELKIDKIGREIKSTQLDLEGKERSVTAFIEQYGDENADKLGERIGRDALQEKLDGLYGELMDAHFELQEATVKNNLALNHFLESVDLSHQLQEQYYNQAMGGR